MWVSLEHLPGFSSQHDLGATPAMSKRQIMLTDSEALWHLEAQEIGRGESFLCYS